MAAVTRREGLFLAGVFLVAAFAYLPSLKAPPVYDDVLVSRLETPSLLGPARVPKGVPLPKYAWRPLTEVSLLWMPSRAGNLLLHLAASGLVFLLVRRLEPSLAPWAAAFFSLHPLGVQAAAYLYQRAVLLESALAFSCLLFYLRARDSGSRPDLALAWVSALFAAGAKETGAAIPLLLGVVELVWRRPGGVRRWLPFTLPALLVSVQVLRTRAGEGDLAPWEYLWMELPIVVGYLKLAFLPFPLHFLYDRWTPPSPLVPLVCGAALLAGILWVLRGSARAALPRAGFGLFLGALALESSLFPLADLGFNHRVYPGLLGASLVFAWAVRSLPWGAGALALALLAQGLMAEVRAWSDPSDLVRRDLRHAWHQDVAWANAGWRALELGHPQAALPLYRRALSRPDASPRSLAGAARALADLGRLPDARRLSDLAVERFPSHLFPLWIAVDVAEREGDRARLARLADRAQGFPCLHPTLARWLAVWRIREGDLRRAEEALARTLEVFPGDTALRRLHASIGKDGS